MEMQNVLYTEKVKIGKRTYYFDLKQTEDERQYLVITQTRQVDEDKNERQRIFIFESDLQNFSNAFISSLMQFHPAKKKGRKLSEAEIELIRKDYPRAFYPWTKEENEQLVSMSENGESVEQMAKQLLRKSTAIEARLRSMNIEITAEVAA